jgi:hypothetical protein
MVPERSSAGGQHDAANLPRAACLEGLEYGAVLTVDREEASPGPFGQIHDQRPTHYKAFLVGQCDRFARFDCRPGSLQSGTADNCGNHDIDLPMGRDFPHVLGPDEDLRLSRKF